MGGTEYTLTGFDDFLERRRIVFIEPLPRTRVCGVCGVVPSHALLLPCGDVLCRVCKGEDGMEDGTCPLDGMTFTEADIVSVSFKQCHLEQHRVYCIVEGGKCSFIGKLSELKDHLVTCGNDEVTCAKCQRSVIRIAAAEHCRQCSSETSPRQNVSSTVIASATEKISGMKKWIREHVSSGKVNQNDIVNCTNSLVERVAPTKRDFIQARQNVAAWNCDPSLSAMKKGGPTAIPLHAASKRDVLIATCAFTDICAVYKALTEDDKTWAFMDLYARGHKVPTGDDKEYRLSTDTTMLAGYTFQVQCVLTKQRNEKVVVSFSFFLGDGAWDDWVEWPFSKKVTIVLRHPRDQGRDVRLPSRMGDPDMVKKPSAESWNRGSRTKTKSFKNLELQGFFRHENLYINVEFH